MNYTEFITGKEPRALSRGLDCVPELRPHLFAFQRQAVEFGVRAGCWGLFFDTGLGKTACELEWCRIAASASNGRALILTPLAVARQIETEGKRWGYDIRVIREMTDARDCINVCNYDRLGKLDAAWFGAVALDESSILKNFTGATSRALINAFAGHRWRMAATATPAPNDHMELGQHCEFLGVMPSNEMLMRWFIADQTQMGRYRLKGHAVRSFWDWMASWSRMAGNPSDMGDPIDGFDLEPFVVIRHQAEEQAVNLPGELFGSIAVSATDMHRVKRQTIGNRAAIVAALVHDDRQPWIVWCDTDYEADALKRAIGDEALEVRGSQPIEVKEERLEAFLTGAVRVLLTKPSIAGHGLNLQHCARMVFAGRSFSYESWYQAVRRVWRFGQQRRVQVHVVVAAGEDSIGRVIDRKSDDHVLMKQEMAAAMHRAMESHDTSIQLYEANYEGRLPTWL